MRRMVRRIALLTVLSLVACTPPPPPPDGGTGGGRGGGTGGGGGLTPFGVSDLDPNARDATYFAVAFDPAAQRVGVAYYTPAGTETMVGRPDFDLKYVEWRQGAIVVPPERIRLSQVLVGLSVAFDPISGDPFVGFVGGPEGFVVGQSNFWFQNDSAYARRTNGTWTQTTVASNGDEVFCGNRVSDFGFLVGLWSAMAFDSTGKLYFGYRDTHSGAFPQQDWAGSDVEVWEGVPRPSMGVCVAPGGDNKNAYGGHLKMIIGKDNQPAIVHDQMFGTADTNGQNVIFQQRRTDGTWSTAGGTLLAISNTQTGATLAYDATEGFGIAVVDRATNQLSYINSANGTAWSAIDPVFGAGSGGWYPSLSMDPINHEPAIAFYVCSARSSVTETGCNITEDELRVTQRISGNWREVVVDPGGGYAPQLGFFANGKRVVVYRVPPAIDPANGLPVSNTGALKIAVER